MEKRLFKPLGMDECGFGAPLGDAPWGHQGLAPVDPEEPGSDNPPGLGPAGTVHCSMASWGAFAQLHILGAEHPSGLLSESQVAALHTPVDGYALGWGVLDNQPWAEGPALAHDGSNTMWYATIWVAPGVQRAYLVATNAAPASAGLATSEVVGVLVAEDF